MKVSLRLLAVSNATLGKRPCLIESKWSYGSDGVVTTDVNSYLVQYNIRPGDDRRCVHTLLWLGVFAGSTDGTSPQCEQALVVALTQLTSGHGSVNIVHSRISD
jgi:hypothetical protein